MSWFVQTDLCYSRSFECSSVASARMNSGRSSWALRSAHIHLDGNHLSQLLVHSTHSTVAARAVVARHNCTLQRHGFHSPDTRSCRSCSCCSCRKMAVQHSDRASNKQSSVDYKTLDYMDRPDIVNSAMAYEIAEFRRMVSSAGFLGWYQARIVACLSVILCPSQRSQMVQLKKNKLELLVSLSIDHSHIFSPKFIYLIPVGLKAFFAVSIASVWVCVLVGAAKVFTLALQMFTSNGPLLYTTFPLRN